MSLWVVAACVAIGAMPSLVVWLWDGRQIRKHRQARLQELAVLCGPGTRRS